jgi:hypothetical protein
MPAEIATLPSDRPRRILSLDGGGIRGVFTLQILARIEELLRKHRGKSHLVLADEFDLIAGTSTGAIIATMLSWGMSVEQIESNYTDQSAEMFKKAGWRARWKAKYSARAITDYLRKTFSEDGAGKVPAQLGTRRLRTLLLLVMRNATTGSAWPVSNNRKAKYNDEALSDCNLKIELWQLVRASTAAPTYFPPEQIRLGATEFIFIDGGITPYNNPALIAFLMATLPSFNLNWGGGVDRLRVVSVGTGDARAKLNKDQAVHVNWLDSAKYVIPALMQSVNLEQDLLCRVLGSWVGPDVDSDSALPADREMFSPIDDEIGGLTRGMDGLLLPSEKKFGYIRYNRPIRVPALDGEKAAAGDSLALDDLRLIPMLKDQGRAYATRAVQLAHLGVT